MGQWSFLRALGLKTGVVGLIHNKFIIFFKYPHFIIIIKPVSNAVSPHTIAFIGVQKTLEGRAIM
jgi:hypothetical protein